MHELPGLTAETCNFADYIVENGFHVAMPLFFGKPLQRPKVGPLDFAVLCLRKEFHCFASGKSSPITTWLKALCRKIHADCGGSGVGAIGMCFSGGFVLSMMVARSVAAPVTAQPSLPLTNAAELDADDATLRQANARAETAPLLGLRFAEDWRCKDARFQTLNDALCGDRKPCRRFRQVIVPGKGHSTLTFDYQTALERKCNTRDIVVRHLRDLLVP
jgi:dienelactone hydrolase